MEQTNYSTYTARNHYSLATSLYRKTLRSSAMAREYLPPYEQNDGQETRKII